jgi:hypothetical protein
MWDSDSKLAVRIDLTLGGYTIARLATAEATETASVP